jgi:quinol-cytochrome oxidoreductase complex cytochrome b subunit
MPAAKTLWKKLIWAWKPGSEFEAGDSIVRNLLLHWFPSKVAFESLSFRYSLWLGTSSAILFAILTVTGVVLMFLYVPSVERAYASVKDIEYAVAYGWFLRGLHRIGAHVMVFVVFFHMIRVFLTGGYKNGVAANQNRPINWIIGVVLLLSTLLLSFTGYLLPWDQLAFWAITVGTNIALAAPLVGEQTRFLLLGGNEIAQSALIRFYVLHCFVLPTVVLLLFAWHMWRIRKDGGLACVDQIAQHQKEEKAPPVKSKTYSLLGIAGTRTVHVDTALVDEDRFATNSSPSLTRRLLLVILVTMVIASLMAIGIEAPLEEPANPAVTSNPAKAPWYFLWLQELVADTTVRFGGFTLNGALVGGIVIPGILAGLLVVWPYLDRSSVRAVGVWFGSERWRQNIVFLVVILAIVILTIVGTFMRGPYWVLYWPWEAWEILPRPF